jgi:hypothetical protein
MKTLDDWPRVKRVLEEALARHGADRQAYLADACAADATLRARVETLLATAERAGTFLESPAARLLEQTRLREDLSGRVVSSYRLLGGLSFENTSYLEALASPMISAARERFRRGELLIESGRPSDAIPLLTSFAESYYDLLFEAPAARHLGLLAEGARRSRRGAAPLPPFHRAVEWRGA